jgi:branched-chain amino acid transport system permease protein
MTASNAIEKPPINLGATLTEAGIAALIALALALPLAGFRLPDGGGSAFTTRPWWVVVAVVVVFVGRMAFALWRHNRSISHGAGIFDRILSALAPYSRIIFIGFFALVALLPLMPFADRRMVDLGTLVMIYIMLGWGLNIVVGLAGLLDLGYVAFYAVGAYSYTLLAVNFGLSFWQCLPLAGLFAGLFGVLLGFPVLRLRGDYLAIVTLGFGEMVRIILINWSDLTGGSEGITAIPGPSLMGLKFTPTPGAGETAFHQFFSIPFAGIHKLIFLYYIILALALVTHLFSVRIRRLPVGRAWEALREDETACRSLGLNPVLIKLSAFGIGAVLAGFAGSFFATRQGFINPSSFTFIESAIILAIVVLGGMGSQVGVICAALVLILLPELARDFAEFRMLLFGGVMVAIMVWRPRGLLVTRDPSVMLHGFDLPVAGTTQVVPKNSGTNPLLQIEHLTMRFGGLTAIDDLSFAARAGDITAVIGPNGAGKTTVFNCITGFYRPDVGRMCMDHDGGVFLLERMEGYQISATARVARTFQNIRLFPRMTVLENLMVAQHGKLMRASWYSFAGLLGLSRFKNAEARAVADAKIWLERLDLVDVADTEAGTLSYGVQRKIEIGRAMCTRPRLLCLDEPAAGLNPNETQALNKILTDIRDQTGIGILLIEHDMAMVMDISDHIIVLDHGARIADGTPDEIRKNPAVIRAYLGEEDGGHS